MTEPSNVAARTLDAVALPSSATLVITASLALAYLLIALGMLTHIIAFDRTRRSSVPL